MKIHELLLIFWGWKLMREKQNKIRVNILYTLSNVFYFQKRVDCNVSWPR